jgi:glycosyltransferase involved in cell wall biosynthesis
MQKTVLFLHRGGSQIRGTEEALLTLLRGLDRDEFRPLVCYSDPVIGAAVADLGVEGHLQSYPEIMLNLRERRFPLRRYLRALKDLTSLCRSRGVELVVCNGGGPCQLGVPLAARLRIPTICMYHHPAPRSYEYEWLMGFVDTLIFSSRFTADHTERNIGKRGEVVYIGIDAHQRFVPVQDRDLELRCTLGVAPDEFVFAQVGALVPHKGHDTLLQAFAAASQELPQSRLLIIGAGPEAARLQGRVRDLGLDGRVTFTGFVDDITLYFRHVIDVNVLASREEGLGLVNLQASACEIPNIGSDGTGIRETIRHGETGFLLPVDDAEAFADSMVLLGRSPALRAEVGRQGRQFVLEHFSHSGSCVRIQEIMRSTLRPP